MWRAENGIVENSVENFFLPLLTMLFLSVNFVNGNPSKAHFPVCFFDLKPNRILLKNIKKQQYTYVQCRNNHCKEKRQE